MIIDVVCVLVWLDGRGYVKVDNSTGPYSAPGYPMQDGVALPDATKFGDAQEAADWVKHFTNEINPVPHQVTITYNDTGAVL